MKELRCIVFNEQEVVNAILDRKRRRRESVPAGQVAGVSYRTEGGSRVILHMAGGDGSIEDLTVDEEETMAAVIAYCMGRKIPLPVESDKFVYFINHALALMITMNFNRQPRLVVSEGSGDRNGRGWRPLRQPPV